MKLSVLLIACVWGHLPWSFLHCGCLLWSKFLFEISSSILHLSHLFTWFLNIKISFQKLSINKRCPVCSYWFLSLPFPSLSPSLILSLCTPCLTHSVLLTSSEFSQLFTLYCRDDKWVSFRTVEFQSVYACVKISAEIPGPNHILCKKEPSEELQEIID